MNKKEKLYRLKDEADISKVVDFLGINTRKVGSAYFVPCPNPDHIDKHATNCYFKMGWNNVYCEVCGAAINAIDLIMYDRHCDFGEAADILWDLEGKPDWYRDTFDKSKKKSFYITKEEMDLIGIKLPGRIYMTENCTEEKPIDLKGKTIRDTLDSYMISKIEYRHWKDLMTEEEFIEMIMGKAYEKFKDIYNGLAPLKTEYYSLRYWGKRDLDLEEMIQNKINDILICQAIYLRAKEFIKGVSA